MIYEVHPVVVLQILDHFARRNPEQKRVIGALLGETSVDNQLIKIKGCFPVPHEETSETLKFDIDFHKTMNELHKKINSRYQLIGWYVSANKKHFVAAYAQLNAARLIDLIFRNIFFVFVIFPTTRYSTASEVSGNDGSLHDYFTKGKSSSLLLLVDVEAPSNKLKAYQVSTLSFSTASADAASLGCNFERVPVRYHVTTQEKIGLNALKSTSADSAIDGNQIDQLENGLQQVQATLVQVQAYVSKVLSGEVKADKRIGRLLHEALSSVNQLQPAVLDKAYNESLQDLLMVSYLANLTKQQLVISEKLHSTPSLVANQ